MDILGALQYKTKQSIANDLKNHTRDLLDVLRNANLGTARAVPSNNNKTQSEMGHSRVQQLSKPLVVDTLQGERQNFKIKPKLR